METGIGMNTRASGEASDFGSDREGRLARRLCRSNLSRGSGDSELYSEVGMTRSVF